MEKLIEPEFDFAQPQEKIDLKEVVVEEKRELQISTISQHLSPEKSEDKSRISQEFMDDHEVIEQELDVVQKASKSKPNKPIVGRSTSIAMTPSSWKSTLVPHFFDPEKSEVSCH